MAKPNMTFKIEDAEIIFRNFAGTASTFNAAGDRNFAVKLDNDIAQQMLDDGWNVKYLNPREEDDEQQAYIQVKIGYAAKPPRVVMITALTNRRTELSEDMIDTLDYADFVNVDLIARAYHWDVNGKQGIKAYLQTMFVTVEEDELEQKYAITEEEELQS